ncbi:MAG: DUF3828 domain-containing protein [Bacteroidaceae bacterium]|nr:DUF3828 domain-containing protein [Bacteroidaceae bacterium]
MKNKNILLLAIGMCLFFLSCTQKQEYKQTSESATNNTSDNIEETADTFLLYTSFYPEWTDSTICDSAFVGNDAAEIPTDLLTQVLPLKKTDKQSMELIYFNHGYKKTSDQYISLFFSKIYDTHSGHLVDKMLYTFTPKGELIDSMTVGRTTHFYEETDDVLKICEIAPTGNNCSFIVKQHTETSVILERGEVLWNTTETEVNIKDNGQISTAPKASLQSVTYENIFHLNPNTPDTFVKHLYDEIVKTYSSDQLDESTFYDYLSPELFQLRTESIQRDQQQNDIPIYDYDLWINAQDCCNDFGISSITKGKKTDQHTRMTVTINNCSETSNITLLVKQINGHWHVDDFISTFNGKEYSIKEGLRKFLSN